MSRESAALRSALKIEGGAVRAGMRRPWKGVFEMSHVCVAVFSRKPEDVRKLMERYDWTEDNPEYMKFYPEEVTMEELRAKYEKENAEYQCMSFEEYVADQEKVCQICMDNGEAEFAPKRTEEELRVEYEEYKAMPLYASFEDFLRDKGYVYNEEQCRFGDYGKPTQRVDCWDEGVEWLHLKAGGWSGQAQLKDIDVEPDEWIRSEGRRFWEVYVEGQPLMEGEDPEKFESDFSREHFISNYGDRETYAEMCATINCWAILTPDGEWHEVGGKNPEIPEKIVMDSPKRFNEMLQQMLRSDPELWLTLLDCHI